MSEQGKSITKSTKKTVKSLDFVVRRPAKSAPKPVSKPASKPAPKSAPKSTPKSTIKSTTKVAPKSTPKPASSKVALKSTPKPKPSKPALSPSKPASKPPVVTRGRFIDFMPSHSNYPSHPSHSGHISHSDSYSTSSHHTDHSAVASVVVASAIDEPDTPISKASEATEISPAQETMEISTAPETPQRHVAPRGIRMDFVSRLNFNKLKPQDDSTLEEELDSLDELSPDDFAGDDIDEIEAEIEAAAETDDFVKAPKPLFEDPLVKLSKARERRESVEQAAEAERFKEEVIAEAEAQAKRSPYAALYSSDHSPFLSSVNVEKRPLSSAPAASTPTSTSSFAAAAKAAVAKATKTPHGAKPISNLGMKRQLADDAKEIHRQTMMMSTPEAKSHKTALIIAIILTIILGAGVGAVIYLFLFQNS